MSKLKRWGIPILCGMIYTAVAVIISQLLLKSAGEIALLLGADEQIAAALGQIRTAPMGSPWLAALLLGALGGGLIGWIPSRKARVWIAVTLGILLLIPCVLAAAVLTKVNTVRLWNVLRSILPYLEVMIA